MLPSSSVENKCHGITWDDFWKNGVKVGEYFDAEKPLPELVTQLSARSLPRGGRALVPGCGRGYDVEALVNSGMYENVIGLDLSETAVEAAKEYLSTRSLGGKYGAVAGDFFSRDTVKDGFTLVYDYTFFCAIPIEWRGKWASRMKELVKVGGVLITVIFPVGKPRESGAGGPPHGVSETDYAELLEGRGGFRRKDGPRVLPDESAHSGRGQGQTWWAVWERQDEQLAELEADAK